MPDANPFQILVIEDNLADASLLRLLFEECAPDCDLHFVQDGDAASDFLEKREPFQFSPTPDLVLMDLNLPRKDGWELLKEMKRHPFHRLVPVILLSTSNNDPEIAQAYAFGAAAFITKPIELEIFRDTIHDLCRFWLNRVRLPTKGSLRQLERTA